MSGDGWRYMDDQPRTCAGCGQKVTLKGSVWFDTMRRRTWHMECRLNRVLVDVDDLGNQEWLLNE